MLAMYNMSKWFDITLIVLTGPLNSNPTNNMGRLISACIQFAIEGSYLTKSADVLLVSQ